MDDPQKLCVPLSATIREAIKTMDSGGVGLICITDIQQKVIGIVTDGDFRRAILNKISLEENIEKIMNKNFRFFTPGIGENEIDEFFKKNVVRHVPVLDKNKRLVEIIIEEEFYEKSSTQQNQRFLDCEVVIMAGGKGTRLEPLTKILPKPLIPIGNKTIIELIIEQFRKYNITNFHLSVNHKANMIQSFFDDISPDYTISYIYEDFPLGTVGAIKQLENRFEKNIFLSNCDILVRADLSKILEHHIVTNSELTIVASLKRFNIPYGVCKIENGGTLKEIQEKPEIDYLVNTGLYVLNPNVLHYIPSGKYYDMTDLINQLQKEEKKISVFPISDNAWTDIGQLDDYIKLTNKVLSNNFSNL